VRHGLPLWQRSRGPVWLWVDLYDNTAWLWSVRVQRTGLLPRPPLPLPLLVLGAHTLLVEPSVGVRCARKRLCLAANGPGPVHRRQALERAPPPGA